MSLKQCWEGTKMQFKAIADAVKKFIAKYRGFRQTFLINGDLASELSPAVASFSPLVDITCWNFTICIALQNVWRSFLDTYFLTC